MQCISISSYNKCLTPATWDFPNITRPFSIIYYVLGGTAFYTIDGKERHFEKGHLYILPANRSFSLREDPNDKFYSVYIHAFTSPEIDSLIHVNVQEDEFLHSVMELMERYAKCDDPTYIHHLTAMILDYLDKKQTLAKPQLPELIKEYIDSKFIEIFQYNDLSEHFNYSGSHLSKVFREKYNLTPKQYARQLVMREAVLLLRESCSVAEIADRLQFSSPENFSRFFKAYGGCAPTEYARRFKDFPI